MRALTDWIIQVLPDHIGNGVQIKATYTLDGIPGCFTSCIMYEPHRSIKDNALHLAVIVRHYANKKSVEWDDFERRQALKKPGI